MPKLGPDNGAMNIKKRIMEKRILGIILTLLGIVGLIMAGYYFMKTGHGTKDIKSIVLYGILGAIFFVAGIRLVKNTADRPT